jgi:hypothetical protein
MAPIPGAFDPPTYSPNIKTGLFGLGFCSQISAAIAGGQILAIGEGLAALHHRQIDGSAIAEHFGHGAAVTVFCLGADRHHRTDRGQLLKLLLGGTVISAGGRLLDLGVRLGAAKVSDTVRLFDLLPVETFYRLAFGKQGRRHKPEKFSVSPLPLWRGSLQLETVSFRYLTIRVAICRSSFANSRWAAGVNSIRQAKISHHLIQWNGRFTGTVVSLQCYGTKVGIL